MVIGFFGYVFWCFLCVVVGYGLEVIDDGKEWLKGLDSGIVYVLLFIVCFLILFGLSGSGGLGSLDKMIGGVFGWFGG